MKNKLGTTITTTYTNTNSYTNTYTIIADNAIDISTMKTTISDLKSQRDTQDAKVLKLKQEVNDLKVTNASSEATKEGINFCVVIVSLL